MTFGFTTNEIVIKRHKPSFPSADGNPLKFIRSILLPAEIDGVVLVHDFWIV